MLVDLAQSDFHFVERFLAGSLLVTSSNFGWECAQGSSWLLSTLSQSCGFLRAKLIFALLASFILQDLLTFASLGFRSHLHCLLGRGGRDDLSNLTLDAPGSGCSVDNPDNSLIGSISLFEGLFQRPRVVRPMLVRTSSCASCNC